jgi:hypothetical protein
MFEVIRYIVEAVSKSFSAESISNRPNTSRMSEIGTELYLLYSALNNILVGGREIVAELESTVKSLEQYASEGDLERVQSTRIGFMLGQQVIQVVQFTESLKRLGPELQVIAPESFVPLAPLISGQLGVLNDLIGRYTGDDNTPLLYVPEDRLQALGELARSQVKQRRLSPGAQISMVSSFVAIVNRSLLEEMVIHEGIENLSRIPAKKCNVLKAYLKRRTPHKTLDRIEAVAHQLRNCIETNFSLRDILVKVGDPRIVVSKNEISWF